MIVVKGDETRPGVDGGEASSVVVTVSDGLGERSSGASSSYRYSKGETTPSSRGFITTRSVRWISRAWGPR